MTVPHLRLVRLPPPSKRPSGSGLVVLVCAVACAIGFLLGQL